MRKSEMFHTLKLAVTAVGILFLGVSVFAYAWGNTSPWPSTAPLDRHIESGSAAGTRMLERELASAHPAGSDAAALLARLRASGMNCEPDPRQMERYACTYRQPRSDRYAVVAVNVSVEQGRVINDIASTVTAPR